MPALFPTTSLDKVNPIRLRQTIIGILIWCGVIALGALGLRQASIDSPEAGPQIFHYLTSSTRDVDIEFPSRRWVAVNDPVFLVGAESARPIGRVSKLDFTDDEPPLDPGSAKPSKRNLKINRVSRATVTLFAGAPVLRNDASFVFQSTPQSTEWVIKTMLPEDKRHELVTLIMNSYRRHMPAIAAAFEPVVKNSLATAGSMIQADLKVAFKDREQEFLALGKRFEVDLLQQKIVPLLEEEVWPIIEKEGTPLAKEIGTEVWQELSLWRFGWRFLYDRSPLPERNFTEQEFDRFVREKAAPILKAHLPDMLELQKSLVAEFANHPKIRQTVRQSFQTVVNDEELRKLLTSIFQEVLIDNTRLKQTMEQQWTGPQAKAAIDLANKRLDPTINAIGEAMFGNPNKSITPEFARVLRRMVLHKDERWLILDPGTDARDAKDVAGDPGHVFRVKIDRQGSMTPSAVVPDFSAGSVD